jgi:hypothetical protein
MVRALIEAGADQTCRDNAGNNMCHSLLGLTDYMNFESEVSRFEELLSTIDSRLIVSLFKERTTALPGAATPLARWMYQSIRSHSYSSRNHENTLEKFVEVILKFSQGEDLDAVNSEGDTPVHAAVRYEAAPELRTMLECRLELLFRENATGRTPYEMAQEAYLSNDIFNDPPSINGRPRSRRRGHWYNSQRDEHKSIIEKPTASFVEDKIDRREGTEQVWEVCKEFAEKSTEHKRKLVSLVEASEVAKRLAARKKQTAGDGEAETDTAAAAEKDRKHDEVAVWFNMGLRADE